MKEIWLPVIGYEQQYKISNVGEVLNIKNNKILKKGKYKSYCTVFLTKDGKGRTYYVHRLVLLAFVGKPRFGQICCHNDGDGFNNKLDNLRWDSSYCNTMDRIKHKEGKSGRITWDDFFIKVLKELMREKK